VPAAAAVAPSRASGATTSPCVCGPRFPDPLLVFFLSGPRQLSPRSFCQLLVREKRVVRVCSLLARQDAPDIDDLSLAKALKIDDDVVFNFLIDTYELHKVRCVVGPLSSVAQLLSTCTVLCARNRAQTWLTCVRVTWYRHPTHACADVPVPRPQARPIRGGEGARHRGARPGFHAALEPERPIPAANVLQTETSGVLAQERGQDPDHQCACVTNVCLHRTTAVARR
jgi:hypothetical protein